MGFVGKGLKEEQSLMGAWLVKFYLTNGQVWRLLCIGGRCNLNTVRSNQSTEYAHMNNIQVIERFVQALLAVIATAASVLVFQFAMLAG
jgi:hypothetical protein